MGTLSRVFLIGILFIFTNGCGALNTSVGPSNDAVESKVAPSPPSFVSINPTSPSDNTSPLIKGITDTHTLMVAFYSDSACTTTVGGGIQPVFISGGVPIAVPRNSTVSIYARSFSREGLSSSCVYLTSYTQADAHQGGALVLKGLSIQNTSPTKTAIASLLWGGYVGAPIQWCLLESTTDSAACTWQNLPLPGAYALSNTQGTKVLTAWLRDADGQVSPRVQSNSVVLDTIPPGALSSVVLSPVSGSSVLTPFVRGIADSDTMNVGLFSDSTCAVGIGYGSKALFETLGIQILATSGATTSIYSKTYDLAGNTSACLSLASYQHNPTGGGGGGGTSLSLGMISIQPTSPSGSTSPVLKGWASSDVQTINFYTDSDCSTLIKSDSKAVFIGGGSTLTVPVDSNFLIFAKALDASANSSSCTYLTQYRTDNQAPTWSGSITHADTSSSLVSSPIVTIQMNASDASGLRHYEYAVGTGDSSGSPLSQADVVPWKIFDSGLLQVTSLSLAHGGHYYVNVRVTDVAGNIGPVRSSAGWVVDTVAPASAPVITASTPASPSNISFAPKLIGTATADTENILFFADSSCASRLGAGTKAQFTSTGVTIALTPNTSNSIYTQAEDRAGNLSACSAVAFNYEHDNVPPLISSFAVLSASPTNSSTIELGFGGVIGNPTEYCLQENSILASGCVWKTLPFLSTLSLTTINEAKTISLWLKDAAGNISARADSNSIILDTVAPNIPTSGKTVPVSPNSAQTPFVSGVVDVDVASVSLYSDSLCTSNIGAGMKSQFISTGIVIAVGIEQTTNIYAKSFDAAGNSSACSLLTSYTHSLGDANNLALGLISMNPSSPGNLDHPLLLGWASTDVATVKIFSDSACSTLLLSDSKAVFTGAGSAVPVSINANTLIFAQGVDAAAKTSPCTFLTQYRHDNTAPSWTGTITHSEFSSSLTESPQVSVQMNATDLNGIRKYEYALGTANFSGTAALQADVQGWTEFNVSEIRSSSLSLTNGTRYYVNVRVTDMAGNITAVRSSLGWIVDNVPPASAPVILASNPLSPSNITFAPQISGTTTADTDIVQFFANSNCTGLLGSGTRSQFEGGGISVSLSPNAINTIYTRGVDVSGNASVCSVASFTYEHSNLAPTISSFSITSSSPTNNGSYSLYFGGTVGLPTQYCLQENSLDLNACSWQNLPLPASYAVTAVNNEKILSLWLKNAAGNVSSRIDSNPVRLDTVAPNAALAGTTMPLSPGPSLTPFISGAVDSDVKSISLFSDNLCQLQVGEGSRSQFTTSGVLISVGVSSTTNIYAKTFDAAGNSSTCAALVSYQHLNTTTEPEMSFSISGLTVDEGVGSVSVSVRLSKARNVDTDIPFTVTGTANQPMDHDLVDGTVRIPAYTTEGFINFSIYDDPILEDDENIIIKLGNAPAGVANGPILEFTLTIKDNDTLIPNTLAHQITSISSAQHTCVVIGGGLACWGRNDYGQIGDGTSVNRTRPYYPPGLQSGVTKVSTGIYNTCVIQNGAAKCWGYNAYGQLGDGTVTNSLVPVQVVGLTSGVTDISIDGNAAHACAIHNTQAKCWGYNGYGQLGDGMTSTRYYPAPVVGLESGVTKIQVTSSYESTTYGHRGHTCAIHKGAAKCWGYNGFSQLGDGTTGTRYLPTQVTGLTSGVTDISIGTGIYGHSCAVHKGAAKCWGYNSSGQLGDGTLTTRAVPVQVFGMSENVTQIQAYYASSCAIMKGELRCWGYNTYGQLGDTSTTNTSNPVQVDGMPDGVELIGSGAGDSYTSCGTRRGILSCWGYNGNGSLADGSTIQRNAPVRTIALDYSGRSNISKVVHGHLHTCAIQDGGVKCWGYNDYGQLGNGSTVTRTAPTPIKGLETGVTDIVAGRYGTCAIQNGGAKCWGYNGLGQLGDGTSANRYAPVQVVGLTANVEKIYIKQGAAEYDFTCAIHGGAAKCWGYNGYGQLGDGTVVNKTSPTQVIGLESGVTEMSLSSDGSVGYVCAIKNGGAFCWGYNGYGQLGDGTTDNSSVPKEIAGLETGVTQIVTSGYYGHTCAIVNDGLKCWGRNNYGQLGVGNTTTYSSPRNVTGLSSGVSKVVTAGRNGYSYTCAIQNGAPLCWGYNGYGQLGDGTNTTQLNPTPVVGLAANATDIAVSDGQYGMTCSLHAGGELKCWGLNNRGQLGDGTGINSSVPKSIFSKGVTAITLQDDGGDINYSTFIKDGIIFSAGRNDYGQVGDGGTINRTTPVEIPLFLEPDKVEKGIVKIAAGRDHTCSLISGKVECWGKNTFGQLGNGSVADSGVPIAVPSLSADVSDIEAGDFFTCATKLGSAYCWGNNGSGQLGNNTAVSSATPIVPIGLQKNVTKISAGRNHTCAIQGNSVKCWGLNTFGQLGDSSTTSSLQAVSVSDLDGVTEISSGDVHSCAVNAGEAFCWGNNGSGRLGDGSSVSSAAPVRVLGMNQNVTKVSAGKSHTCGVMSGAAYCWGLNTYGQLGDNSVTPRFDPTPVWTMGVGVTSISAGDEHTCAVKAKQVRCWGRNQRSQLGVGTGSDRYQPAVVSAISDITDVVAGNGHTCAIRRNVAFCWGANDGGQVGDGTLMDMPVPYRAQ